MNIELIILSFSTFFSIICISFNLFGLKSFQNITILPEKEKEGEYGQSITIYADGKSYEGELTYNKTNDKACVIFTNGNIYGQHL